MRFQKGLGRTLLGGFRIRGRFNPRTNEIVIDSTASPERQKEAVIHELLEKIVHEAKTNVPHTVIEQLSQRMARTMTAEHVILVITPHDDGPTVRL